MKKTIASILTLIAILALLFLVAAPAQAQPSTNQVNPSSLIALTNVPATMPATTQSNRNSQWFAIDPVRGFGIMASVISTNATTNTAVTFQFDLSPDRTRVTTTQPVRFQVPLNGTSSQIGFTNVPAAMVGNARWGRFSGLTNSHTTGGTTISNLWIIQQ